MMRIRTLAVALLLALSAPATGAEPEGYAIVGATVHTVADAGTLENAVLLVSDGEIEAVGVDVSVPGGYEIVPAGGRVVTPGFIDPYTQLGIEEIGGEASTVDSLVAEHASGAAFDIRYAVNPESTAIAVNRRDGLTRAVVAPRLGNDPFAGWGGAIRLTESASLYRAELALFGALGVSAAAFTGGSRSAAVQRLRRGLTLARGYNPARYNPGPGDFSHQDLEALQRFLSARVPLVLRAERAVEIREALALAREFRLQLTLVGATEGWKVAAELAAAETPVIVNVMANLPSSFERLGARLDNAALLEAAGVPLLLTGGQTQNAVRWQRQGAGNAIAHGLSPEAALRAVTRAPAAAFGLGDELGRLTRGAPADLVIWTGDPFELSSWPERVMIDGTWQSLESRQTRLFERYRDLKDESLFYR